MAMNAWELSRIAHECENRLGLKIRQEFDQEKVAHILKDMGKEFLSPILDPSKNDFTPANSFWLIAEDDGKPVIAGGVRFDDLRDVDVRKYWDRMLFRLFGQRPSPEVLDFPTNVLSERIAYFGDLWAVKGIGLSKIGRANLRLFTGVGHYLTQLEFEPDVTYCFVQDRDVQRGTPAVYGFLELWPFLYSWDKDPYPAGCPEWIACTHKKQFPQLMASLRRFTAG